MTGFAGIPFAGFAVLKERFFRKTFPDNAVFAFRHSDLLRGIIVSSGIKHIKFATFLCDRSPFDTFSFPRIHGIQDRGIRYLYPVFPVEIGIARSNSYSLHLDVVVFIAGCKIEEIASFELTHFRIYGTPTSPISDRMENRIRRIPSKMNAVIRYGMADGIFLPIPVCLIKQMHLSILHQRTGCTKSFLLIISFGSRRDLAHLRPVHQILTLRNPNIPSGIRFPLHRRNGMVHQIAPLKINHMRIFRIRDPDTGGIAV